MFNEVNILKNLKKNLREEIEREFIRLIQKYKTQVELEDAESKISECLRELTQKSRTGRDQELKDFVK